MAWKRPDGEIARFRYEAPGVLSRFKIGDHPPVELKMRYVSPKEGGRDQMGKVAKRDIANYWLEQDDQFQYTYGGKSGRNPRPDQITLTDEAGIKQKVDFAASRGLLTADSTSGVGEKFYYYRAPGQRYNGKLRRVERDGKIQIEYRYDRKTGLLSQILDENGEATFFEYPKVDGGGGTTKDGWDIKPVRIRRGDWRSSKIVAEYRYDEEWRLTGSKDETGRITKFAFTPRGDLAAVDEAGAEKTLFTYDAFGRITSVARGEQKETVEFDGFGRVAARTGVDGAEVTFERDERGNVERVLRDGELLVENVYDEKGRPTGEIDPLGRERKIERDAIGNVTAEIEPNGTITRYEYDAKRRRTAQIDGNGNRIEFTYDAAGRLVEQTNPIGGRLTWKYDPAGKLIERTNGEQTIRYAHDKNGKLSSIDYGAGQTIQYQYDKEGRITTASTPTTSFESTYDDEGRVEITRALRKTGDGGVDEQLLRYRFDDRGRRTGLLLAELVPAVPSNGAKIGKEAGYNVLAQVDYTYDGIGRLTAITCNGLPITSYGYDSLGRVISKQYGNGINAAISYDARSRLGTTTFTGGPFSDAPTVLAYEWDAANQVTRRAWNGETQRYEYDQSGQLLKVIDDGKDSILEQYAYDKAGNMLEKTVDGTKTAMTYNAANQLTTVNSASQPIPYDYDRAGRMLGAQGGARSAYGWLDKVVELTTEDGRKLGYEYWPDGQLAAKRNLSADDAESGDGIQKVATRSTTNKKPSPLPETFLWDGLALLRRGNTITVNEPHPSGGAVIASFPVGRTDEMTYYLNDMLGTTLGDVNGNAIRYARLSAFGQQLGWPNIPQPSTIAPPSTAPDSSQNQVIQNQPPTP